ncbi:hypothetical protein PR202_gn00617 [Eleusine coracana subsp. coracana]|uniref:F-box domain-containing protein n=1 Tax=Eleusine coracana subsp. coracana TaxID=191504 RepID=A0AAV5G3A2_ELECO|nr:hypothetical protein PR202_gn00617 [Eleusine coracana subsp. coracana]
MAGASQGRGAGKKPRNSPAERRPADDDDPSRLLPGDVLEDIFRRLAPRWVAACRSVRRAWRDVVDARRLLQEDLLPLKLGGIFFSFVDHDLPDFLARPSITFTIAGWPKSVPRISDWCDTEDHCNGLLLSYYGVVNPATRWSAPLPLNDNDAFEWVDVYHDYELKHLAYDPTISPDYEVISLPLFYYQSEISSSTYLGQKTGIRPSN